MKRTPPPRQTLTPAMKARRALDDAFTKRGKVSKALRCEYAVEVLEAQGMAPDTASAVVERVWRDEFEIMGA